MAKRPQCPPTGAARVRERKFGHHDLTFRIVSLFVLGWFSVSLTGCVSPVRSLYPPHPGRPTNTIYVLYRGLHTGVILRAADIPAGLWPQHQEFPQAEFLEAGWGDSEGYRYPWTARIVLRAMFASKGSVLLIHAFNDPITREYAGIAKELIEVKLSRTGFARLCAYIQHTYALDPQSRPVPLPTVYPEEDFFRAKGHYSILHNCNNWTARALRAAGCPICPRGCVLPETVMDETRGFGTVLPLHNRSAQLP